MANSTALYSFRGQQPQLLPERIRLSDGSTRTDPSSFEDSELADAGFTGPYELPQYNQDHQRLVWNSENLSYVVEDISDEELWGRIRSQRDHLLAASDWTMAADAPEDLNFREWEMYRQRLRDLPNIYANPKDVQWPTSPEGLSDEDFDQPRIHEDRVLWRIRYMEKQIEKIAKEVFPETVDPELTSLEEV
jgi:hypothetical protein